MNIGLRIARAVALESDTDAFYEAAKKFGERAAEALTGGKRSQITGLESCANGTQKVSDVLDYLKLRTARQREWQTGQLGQQLIAFIESELRKSRDTVCRNIGSEHDLDDYQRQDIYIRLVRAFVAQLAAQYEFSSRLTSTGARRV